MDTYRAVEDSASRYSEKRERMIRETLVARGIGDARVLAAMGTVPREEFVPQQFQSEAYGDCPLPIGSGQTVAQPYTVAFMVEALQLKGPERVLEIGTGSGYGAAVLAHLANEVHTVERILLLAQQAQNRLVRLGYRGVHVHAADGTLGLPSCAPFDAIVVTAGAKQLPQAYHTQLAEGGRIVIPIGSNPSSQKLYRFTRQGHQLVKEDLGQFAFVPLIGKHGWPEDAVS